VSVAKAMEGMADLNGNIATFYAENKVWQHFFPIAE